MPSTLFLGQKKWAEFNFYLSALGWFQLNRPARADRPIKVSKVNAGSWRARRNKMQHGCEAFRVHFVGHFVINSRKLPCPLYPACVCRFRFGTFVQKCASFHPLVTHSPATYFGLDTANFCLWFPCASHAASARPPPPIHFCINC